MAFLGNVSTLNNSRLTLGKVNKFLRAKAIAKGISLKIFHHFSHKQILKSLISNRNEVDGMILNFGGMSRSFYSAKEILAVINKPVVEVALAEFPYSKENFNKSSIKEVSQKRIYKNGLDAYSESLDYFLEK